MVHFFRYLACPNRDHFPNSLALKTWRYDSEKGLQEMLQPSANMVQEQMPEFQPSETKKVDSQRNTANRPLTILRFSRGLTKIRQNMAFQVKMLGGFVLDLVESDVIQSFAHWKCGPSEIFNSRKS